MEQKNFYGDDVGHYFSQKIGKNPVIFLLICAAFAALFLYAGGAFKQSAIATKHTNNFAMSGVFVVQHGLAIQKPSCAIGGSPDIQTQANDAGPNGAGSKKLNVEFLSPDQYSPWTVNNLGFDKYEKLTVTIGCSFK